MFKKINAIETNNLRIILLSFVVLVLAIVLKLQVINDVSADSGISVLIKNSSSIIIIAVVLFTAIYLIVTNKNKLKNALCKSIDLLRIEKNNKDEPKLLISGNSEGIETDSDKISIHLPINCRKKEINLKNIEFEDSKQLKITMSANQINDWQIFFRNKGIASYCAASDRMKDTRFNFDKKYTEIIDIPQDQSFDTISIDISNIDNEDITFNIHELQLIR